MGTETKENLPTICPGCESKNTVHIDKMDVSTCLDCELSWWWSEDDGAIVNDGAFR